MEDALKDVEKGVGKGTGFSVHDIDNDLLDDLLFRSDEPEMDDAEAELTHPDTYIINLDDVNNKAEAEAVDITNRLSGYYFDQKYIDEHPYIPNKISQEMNNIRRLLKMLAVNEKAQDSLISSITSNSGKGSLYHSLTALQNTTLNIQSQLNSLTSELEDIFRQMQDECDKTFAERDKEDLGDGSMIVHGSRDFINELNRKLKAKPSEEPMASASASTASTAATEPTPTEATAG